MRSVLQQLKQQGKTVFINSHLLQEVELVCDQVAILVQGEVRQVGTVSGITRTSNDVRFAVIGQEALVAQAVQEATVSVSSWMAEGSQVTFAIAASDQQHVNECIDRLRAHDIDIVAVSPHQDSLESAFLNIVQQSQ
jgi:ABC-2 type transport system ATP-binding protein